MQKDILLAVLRGNEPITPRSVKSHHTTSDHAYPHNHNPASGKCRPDPCHAPASPHDLSSLPPLPPRPPFRSRTGTGRRGRRKGMPLPFRHAPAAERSDDCICSSRFWANSSQVSAYCRARFTTRAPQCGGTVAVSSDLCRMPTAFCCSRAQQVPAFFLVPQRRIPQQLVQRRTGIRVEQLGSALAPCPRRLERHGLGLLRTRGHTGK